jgi:hypothetical protein
MILSPLSIRAFLWGLAAQAEAALPGVHRFNTHPLDISFHKSHILDTSKEFLNMRLSARRIPSTGFASSECTKAMSCATLLIGNTATFVASTVFMAACFTFGKFVHQPQLNKKK